MLLLAQKGTARPLSSTAGTDLHLPIPLVLRALGSKLLRNFDLFTSIATALGVADRLRPIVGLPSRATPRAAPGHRTRPGTPPRALPTRLRRNHLLLLLQHGLRDLTEPILHVVGWELEDGCTTLRIRTIPPAGYLQSSASPTGRSSSPVAVCGSLRRDSTRVRGSDFLRTQRHVHVSRVRSPPLRTTILLHPRRIGHRATRGIRPLLLLPDQRHLPRLPSITRAPAPIPCSGVAGFSRARRPGATIPGPRIARSLRLPRPRTGRPLVRATKASVPPLAARAATRLRAVVPHVPFLTARVALDQWTVLRVLAHLLEAEAALEGPLVLLLRLVAALSASVTAGPSGRTLRLRVPAGHGARTRKTRKARKRGLSKSLQFATINVYDPIHTS